MKRVHVPTTLAVWQRLGANGSMFQVSGTAFAVTPGESYPEHNAQSTCSSKACSVPRYKGELRTSPGLSPRMGRVAARPTTPPLRRRRIERELQQSARPGQRNLRTGGVGVRGQRPVADGVTRHPVGELEDRSKPSWAASRTAARCATFPVGAWLTSAVPAPGNPGGVAGCCTGAGCEVHVARAVMIHAAHSTLIGGSHMLLDSSGCRSQDSFTCEYQIRSATATMSSEIAEIRR